MPRRSNTPKNKKNPPKKQKQKKNKAQMHQLPGVGLSHCAMKYALAIANPWDPMAEGACVPRHPSRPSQKIRAFMRATVTIGKNGFGFCYYSPTTANDSTVLRYSTSLYTGSTIETVSIGTVGTESVNLTSNPYNTAQLTPSSLAQPPFVSGRIVAAAISWQYTGTVSDMGGLTYSLVHPEHSNLNLDAGQINGYAETQIIRVDNKRHWCGISAIDEREIMYSEPNDRGAINDVISLIYPYSNAEFYQADSGTTGGAPIAIWFTGKAGNTFQVEMVQHEEFIGRLTQAALTPSHSDAVGFEVVSNAAARLPALLQSNPTATRQNLMSRALQTVAREMAPVVRLGAEQFITAGARAAAGAAFGYITGGPTGAVYGGALGVSSGQLRITG